MAEEKPYGCYSDGNSSNLVSHFQSFDVPPPEIYNMTASAAMWKGFGNNHHDGEISEFYNHQQNYFNKKNDLSQIWHHQNQNQNQNQHQNQDYDDPSLRCVFTYQGINERPSQGLSLSLSSTNPNSSDLGLQSFQNDPRFGPSSSRSVNIHEQTQMMEDQTHIRNSRYLIPAQELLSEFCSITRRQQTDTNSKKKKNSEDENALRKQSLFSLDLLDLQRRKTKLLQMLDEVDRRYKHYCDQMKSVTSSFESVAGNGAATVYSALASEAMSRHFRCLRDGIVAQIKATKKAMGEKDVGVPGTVKGETPRLRVLDQTLRQQKAMQQMSLMETHPWRPQRGLPERSVSVLRAWLFEHFLHPYPSDVDKHILARQTGLSRSQVSNWFINARVRLWKPMVEEMYLEELKENDDVAAADETNHNPSRNEDQKPTHEQLVRIDSECLSSIINNPEKNRAGESYGGAMELDFASGSGAAVNYGGGGVSLTLGLHQHGGGGGGVSLAFTNAAQSSMFYDRDHHHIEDCQTVPYSLMDNENQTLPYRNLMGAQLLHDLAG